MHIMPTDNLSKRFPDSKLMMALQIFDPRELPATRTQWAAVATTYGKESINVLIATFGMPQVVSGSTSVRPPRARRCLISAGTSGYVICRRRATAPRTAMTASSGASGMHASATSAAADMFPQQMCVLSCPKCRYIIMLRGYHNSGRPEQRL